MKNCALFLYISSRAPPRDIRISLFFFLFIFNDLSYISGLLHPSNYNEIYLSLSLFTIMITTCLFSLEITFYFFLFNSLPLYHLFTFSLLQRICSRKLSQIFLSFSLSLSFSPHRNLSIDQRCRQLERKK